MALGGENCDNQNLFNLYLRLLSVPKLVCNLSEEE